MLREKLIGHHTYKPHEFRWRSREISRLEGLSDAVFGFAITLLIVALEVPKTSGELLEIMRGFLGFAFTFTLLYMLWYRQFTFFRRYGLEDTPTAALNGAFLFVVLFFTFPLKFIVGTFVDQLMGGSKTIRLPNGTVEEVIRPEHFSLLLTIYGLGFTAVSLIFLLLYAHAYRKREELDLNELEILDTRRSVESHVHGVVLALILVVVAVLMGLLRHKPHEKQAVFGTIGLIYLYFAFVMYRTRLYGRWRKAMVARLQEVATEGDPGPPLQS